MLHPVRSFVSAIDEAECDAVYLHTVRSFASAIDETECSRVYLEPERDPLWEDRNGKAMPLARRGRP